MVDALIKDIENPKKEIADLKRHHEGRAEKLYETYCGQLKKTYDVDVGFERGLRIQAQELAAQATRSPDTTHELCNNRHQMLEKARDDACEKHDQDVNEKRGLREQLAKLVFDNDSLQTKIREETDKSTTLVSALAQANRRARELTARLCNLPSNKGSVRDNGSKVDIPEDADRNSRRARVQERLMQENEALHSQLLAEKEKAKRLQDELDKEQQCHREAQRQMANDLEYSKIKFDQYYSNVINKYTASIAESREDFTQALKGIAKAPKDLAKAPKDLAPKDKMITHKDNDLALVNWQNKPEIKTNSREKELSATDKESTDKSAKDVVLESANEWYTTQGTITSHPVVAQTEALTSSGGDTTTCQPVVSGLEPSTSFGGAHKDPNQGLALANHAPRLGTSLQSQASASDSKTRNELEIDLASQQAEEAVLDAKMAALETRKAGIETKMAGFEARKAMLQAQNQQPRNHLEKQSSRGCEEHGAEIRRLTKNMAKLKSMSWELTGYIDDGSDALKRCGNAMKEQLRRL